MSTESEQFEEMAFEAFKNKEKEIVEFSIAEGDEEVAAKLTKIISEAGGVGEIWKPIMFGIVTEVEDYWLTEEQQKMLNTLVYHEQKVTWISTTGYKFIRGWNDQKHLNQDLDITDFPEGFKVGDGIRVEADGAVVKKIKRVSIKDIKISMGLEPEDLENSEIK